MAISVKTQKMLWGRAANRCGICRMELVMDATETDDESLVGEACHIVASSPDGPRGESELTQNQRDKYGNLILMCNVHHKVIDDQPIEYTVERLNELKANHEQWVKAQLGIDQHKQRDDELYAGYVEQWATKIDLDNWSRRASGILFHGQPSIDAEMLQSLEDIRPWLLSRTWPHRYQDLEAAFNNFRLVAQDFTVVFNTHAEKWGEDDWQTRKFYKIDRWDEELYRDLSRKFDGHVGLVSDLMVELTRAVNYVCEFVRRDLIHSYRTTEGLALIQSGPHMDLSMRTYRCEYRGDERGPAPYPGLEQFKTVRFTRDLYFGRPGDDVGP